MKKNVAPTATRIIAAAQIRIRVVELERSARSGRDREDEALGAGTEGAVAITAVACCGESCSSGGAIWIFSRDEALGATELGRTLLTVTLPAGRTVVEMLLGGG